MIHPFALGLFNGCLSGHFQCFAQLAFIVEAVKGSDPVDPCGNTLLKIDPGFPGKFHEIMDTFDVDIVAPLKPVHRIKTGPVHFPGTRASLPDQGIPFLPQSPGA
jgi:hypothetical protein